MSEITPAEPNNLEGWTLPQIIGGIQLAETKKADADAAIKALNAELDRRYEKHADELYVQQSKQHGQIAFELDGVALQAEIKKEVKWDSNKLLAISATLPWDRVQKIFDIKLSVPEKIYSTLEAVDDGKDLFAGVTAARTVKYGNITIRPKKSKD